MPEKCQQDFLLSQQWSDAARGRTQKCLCSTRVGLGRLLVLLWGTGQHFVTGGTRVTELSEAAGGQRESSTGRAHSPRVRITAVLSMGHTSRKTTQGEGLLNPTAPERLTQIQSRRNQVLCKRCCRQFLS